MKTSLSYGPRRIDKKLELVKSLFDLNVYQYDVSVGVEIVEDLAIDTFTSLILTGSTFIINAVAEEHVTLVVKMNTFVCDAIAAHRFRRCKMSVSTRKGAAIRHTFLRFHQLYR